MGTWTLLALVLLVAAFVLAALGPEADRLRAISLVLAICAAGILVAFSGG
jgi:hypothetical protein